MLRPLSLLPALVAVTATLVVPAGAGAAAPAAPVADDSPLGVTISTLSPSYVPRKGPIRITGSVTNNDDAPWTTVNVYAFLDETAMTTPAELAEAAETPSDQDVGGRITTPDTYDTIDSIDPGETAQFSVRVPRSEITVTDAGVYWFGVHALGEGPDGRIEGADGRARTFLPFVPRAPRSVDTALVVPLRHQISFTADGRLDRVDSWTRALSDGGDLRTIVDFGASAGSRPITWLLDPALPDAVRALAAGNPPRSLAADAEAASDDGNGTESPSVTPEPTPGASPDTDDEPADEPASVPAETIDAANAWLDRLHEALKANQILALPYGDLDVAAAAKRGPEIYERARKRSGTLLEPWGLSMSPAVSSPRGYLDGPGLRAIEQDATVLCSDAVLPGVRPSVARTAGHRIVLTSSGAAAGGPGPDDRVTPIAVRQRIVSEAALRLLGPGRHPLVVMLPPDWAPSSSAGFFEGLDADWLNLTTVGGATAGRQGPAVPLSAIDYPARLADLELDSASFASARSLLVTGQTLEKVLAQNDTVGETVADQALNSLSYSSRKRPDAARASVDRSRNWIKAQLASVRIEAPRKVTLSSASGRFSATLSNALDQPVTVSIQAVSDEPMRISGPATVDIPAGGRTTVLLNARTQQLGIHNVTLVVTDADGVPLGSTDELPIRAAQVSAVIWVILGVGLSLLFAAIAVRLVRRLRAAARAARAARQQ